MCASLFLLLPIHLEFYMHTHLEKLGLTHVQIGLYDPHSELILLLMSLLLWRGLFWYLLLSLIYVCLCIPWLMLRGTVVIRLDGLCTRDVLQSICCRLYSSRGTMRITRGTLIYLLRVEIRGVVLLMRLWSGQNTRFQLFILELSVEIWLFQHQKLLRRSLRNVAWLPTLGVEKRNLALRGVIKIGWSIIVNLLSGDSWLSHII